VPARRVPRAPCCLDQVAAASPPIET
jgi:hypothetical protein